MPAVLARRRAVLVLVAALLASIAVPVARPPAPVHAAGAFNYWAPWYDNASPGMLQDNVHVLNPTGSPADVTVSLAGAPDLYHSVPAWGEYYFSWPWRTEIGGPLHVNATAAVIVSQRVTYGYSFNEYPVPPATAAGTSFWFPWFDRASPGLIQDNIHFVNVSGAPANINLQLGNNVFSYHLTVAANAADYYAFPSGFIAGPVRVTSDQPVLVSQRVTYNQSFNEIPGVPDPVAPAGKFIVFNWYDWASPGFNGSYVHVTNPSPSATAHVAVTLAGAAEPGLTVAPQSDGYLSFPGLINGPLLLSSDLPVIATQRVDYWGSFKEYPGLTVAANDAWFNWYDNASPCFAQNNIHVYSQGHAFGTITVGSTGAQIAFDVNSAEGYFSFPLGTIGGPVHVLGGAGSAPFYAESRTVRCPPPPPPPPPAPVPAPVTLRVPALGIWAPVESVGADASGNMGVPANSNDVAWFNLMPRPGDGGDSVITGHVSWYTSTPPAFANLPAVQLGMDVYVDRADGSTVHFTVDAFNYYDASSSPPSWLYTTQGAPQLTLITCGGDFNVASGHYNKRLLVHTTMA